MKLLNITFFFRLAGLALLIFIVSKIGLNKLFSCLLNVEPLYIFIVLLLNFFLVFSKALRWNSILKLQKIDITTLNSYIIYYRGAFLGVSSPGSIGEFIKAFYLKNEFNTPLTKGLLSVFIDRLIDLYILIILAIVGLWKFMVPDKYSIVSIILVIVMTTAPLTLTHKFFIKKYSRVLYLMLCKNFKLLKFHDFYQEMEYFFNPKLIITLLLSCLGFIIFFIQCYLLTLGMNIQIDFITITLFMSITRLVSIIPISISGLGTRDAILIYLFSLINLTSELAVSYSFLIFIVCYVFNGIVGACVWIVKPLSMDKSM